MKHIISYREYNYNIIFQELQIFMKDFSNTRTQNKWIHDGNLSIYIRKGYHPVDGKIYKFLDLASIAISEELQGKGIFTEFLNLLLQKYPDINIYVESIHNPAIRHICQKFGFREIDEWNMALIRDKKTIF